MQAICKQNSDSPSVHYCQEQKQTGQHLAQTPWSLRFWAMALLWWQAWHLSTSSAGWKSHQLSTLPLHPAQNRTCRHMHSMGQNHGGEGWSCKNIQVNIHTVLFFGYKNWAVTGQGLTVVMTTALWIGTNLTGTAFSFAYYNFTSLGFVHSQNLKRTKYALALHTVCTFKFSCTTIHITMSYWRMEIILVQFIFTLFDTSKKRKTDSLLLFLLWGITFCHSNLYRKAVTYTKSHQAVWCTSWAPQASARTEDNSNHNFNKCFIGNCSQPIINYISRRKSGQFSVSVHRPVVHHSVGSQWANKLHSISATCNRHICTPCLQQLKPNQTVWQA